jgi:hypothetical protein
MRRLISALNSIRVNPRGNLGNCGVILASEGLRLYFIASGKTFLDMFLWETAAIFASSLLTSTASADFCGTAPPAAF